jgi:single-strand DNA-binding protein
MNQLQFIGNVGRDPEMRFTPSGQAVTNFSVAVSEKYTTAAGEKVNKTVWYRVTTWGKLGENCNQYVKKGSKVFVSGKLNADNDGNPRMYQAKDGTSKANFEVTAHSVEFLSSRENNGNSGSSTGGFEGAEIPAEDDIPF